MTLLCRRNACANAYSSLAKALSKVAKRKELQNHPDCKGKHPVVSTRILGRRTAPLPTFPYSSPRPAWFYPRS